MPEPARLGMTIVNGYGLYMFIGCLSCCVSCASDRRGRAIGFLLVVVVASFLISFLAEYWQPARSFEFMSPLSYYRPFHVLQRGIWPLGHIAVLGMAAVAFWTAGGLVFRRRDIRTL